MLLPSPLVAVPSSHALSWAAVTLSPVSHRALWWALRAVLAGQGAIFPTLLHLATWGALTMGAVYTVAYVLQRRKEREVAMAEVRHEAGGVAAVLLSLANTCVARGTPAVLFAGALEGAGAGGGQVRAVRGGVEPGAGASTCGRRWCTVKTRLPVAIYYDLRVVDTA